MDDLRERRDDAVDTALSELSRQVRGKKFKLQLRQTVGPDGKSIYPARDDAASFFILKQLQHNVHRLYKVIQSNRSYIISQIRDILSNKFPYYIIRADITSFYENIDRVYLLEKLNNDQLISMSSKYHIKQILKSYENLSCSINGVPRGVGISAYLSELYMRDADYKIKSLSDVIYYARYVDDIIVIFAPEPGRDTSKYFPKFESIISNSGLCLNPAKTSHHPLTSGESANFNYLGYKFYISGGKCRISLSEDKFNRYKKRIDNTFVDFHKFNKKCNRKAYRLLVSRVKFLTGNTRLSNSKKHAFTGIYYNSSHLTETQQLTGLDNYLSYKISQLESDKLKNRLTEFSFYMGFLERRYHKFRGLYTCVTQWHLRPVSYPHSSPPYPHL